LRKEGSAIKRVSTFPILFLLFVASASAQVVIPADRFPTAIGDSFVSFTNRDTVAVSFDPGASSWDFSSGPQSDTSLTVLVDPLRSPHRSLFPNAQFVMKSYTLSDTFSAYIYARKNTDSLFAYGLSAWVADSGRYIGRAVYPDMKIYPFPLQAGVTWTTIDSVPLGTLYGFRVVYFDTVRGRVLKEGTVTAPMGGPWPCLLVRLSDRGLIRLRPFGTILDTVYQETAEWLVPDYATVVTIASLAKDTTWPMMRSGPGGYSRQWQMFHTGVEEKAEVRDQGLEVRMIARPNPFLTFTTIQEHEAERFSLYDVSGRSLGTAKGDRIGEGLSPGVYFIKPEDGTTKPLRIVKLK
jgi:hypothetical protein